MVIVGAAALAPVACPGAAEAGAVTSSADASSAAVVVAPMRARDRNRGMAHHFCVANRVNAALLQPPMSSSVPGRRVQCSTGGWNRTNGSAPSVRLPGDPYFFFFGALASLSLALQLAFRATIARMVWVVTASPPHERAYFRTLWPMSVRLFTRSRLMPWLR